MAMWVSDWNWHGIQLLFKVSETLWGWIAWLAWLVFSLMVIHTHYDGVWWQLQKFSEGAFLVYHALIRCWVLQTSVCFEVRIYFGIDFYWLWVQLILLYMWEWVRVHFWLSYFMCNGWSEIYTSFVAVHGASNGWIPPLIHCIWLCLILIEWNVLFDCDFIKHIFEPFYEYHSEIEEYMDYYIEN